MTARAEIVSQRGSKTTEGLLSAADERESRGGKRSSSRGRNRRDRISPEGTMFRSKDKPETASRRTRKQKSKSRDLKVDTRLEEDEQHNSSTPRTDASTPSPTGSTRSNGDLRSPGQRKTPMVATAKIASQSTMPDFITQTDRYGNAVTPRSAGSLDKARVQRSGSKSRVRESKDGNRKRDNNNGDKTDVDACTETFMDSIRIMCCCFVQEEATVQASSKKVQEEKITEVPKLLPEIHPLDQGKKCLVLDLDETLVHSSFRAVPGADFVIPVQIEDVVHFVYVMKRPGVDEFLVEMAKHYELVIYTASLNKYADPLLDLLDPKRVIRSRLFRESCVYHEGNYVKDLSLLNRDLSQSIIIDNSPSSYIFHPENAIDCSSFIDDPADRELDQIAAFLTGVKDVRDVRGLCHQWRDWPIASVEGQ